MSFLKKLIQTHDHDPRRNKLKDDENSIANTELVNAAVHSRQDISDSPSDGDENSQQLLRSIPGGEREREV